MKDIRLFILYCGLPSTLYQLWHWHHFCIFYKNHWETFLIWEGLQWRTPISSQHRNLPFLLICPMLHSDCLEEKMWQHNKHDYFIVRTHCRESQSSWKSILRHLPHLHRDVTQWFWALLCGQSRVDIKWPACLLLCITYSFEYLLWNTKRSKTNYLYSVEYIFETLDAESLETTNQHSLIQLPPGSLSNLTTYQFHHNTWKDRIQKSERTKEGRSQCTQSLGK